MREVLIPLILSFIAGSATGIGGLIVIIFGDIQERVLGFFLGFAGGVMLVISFLQLFIQALSILDHLHVTIAFTFGTIFMMIIDLTLPHVELGVWEKGITDVKLFKSSLIIAIGMSMHNFPEGIVVSAGYTHMPELGVLVAFMICLHNIPEGIATVTPMIKSGASRMRSVGLAFISGMMEPIGAIIGSIVLVQVGGTDIIGYGLGFASGVMTYVTIDELIPVAHEYCSVIHKHIISTGLLLGMLFAQLLSLII
ncbi:MAG: ZIP family metal transporter [Candidatus Bathyarchaeia archaeon]